MSPGFESFLARLYVDEKARTRFLADPAGEAAAAGLTEDEIAAAIRIDRVGLELAAASFGHKRRRQKRPPNPVVAWLRALTGVIESEFARRGWLSRISRQRSSAPAPLRPSTLDSIRATRPGRWRGPWSSRDESLKKAE